MTLRRFTLFFFIALACEITVFAASYRDLLYLRGANVAVPADEPGAFRTTADQALSRRRLTRQHLETIAAGAARSGMASLETQTLERLAREYPEDSHVRLRLADALRRGGDYTRAEALYLELLSSAGQAEEQK